MQNLWKLKLSWDEEVTEPVKKEFWSWVDQLNLLSTIKIPRWYHHGLPNKIENQQLHLFCDASTKAYGAVGYLRSEDEDGNVIISIVLSKVRVAPVKQITLPRLELLGGHVAVKVASAIKIALEIEQIETFYWTDSQVSLAWIKGEPSRWQQYVSNRVRFIQERSTPAEWCFVPGSENPADLCSRGVQPSILADPKNVWWTGPSWLSKSRSEWPSVKEDPDSNFDEINKEKKKSTIVLTNIAAPAALFDETRYGTLTTLLRYTGYILRAYGNVIADRLDRQNALRQGLITSEEMQCARFYWMRHLQQQAFGAELKRLGKNKFVHRDSKLSNFHPYLNKNGLITLKYRTKLSRSLPEQPEVPILPNRLPNEKREPHFITLLVRDVHRRLLHAGVRDTLTELRQTSWILKGRQVVKKILARCSTCNRVNRKPYDQPTGPLPVDRCTMSPPFDVTGVDFAGPVYLRGSNAKSWICLFTCAVTRALHLELVQTLTAVGFLMAFDRFVSRFGICRIVYSDNAKTFHRANKDLAEIWKGAEPEILIDLANRGITWKFIPEGAPWWGGFWERMVKTTKQALIKNRNGPFNRRGAPNYTL
jgi:hypothetical protein